MVWTKEQRRAYERERYARMRDTEQARIGANTAKYRERNAAFVNLQKRAPCSDCGGEYPPECMDWDHVRGSKRNNVADLVVRGVSIQVIIDEIEKCELVCANCHRFRTASRRVAANPPRLERGAFAGSSPAD